MKKIFTENGFLSDDGEKAFSESLDERIKSLLSSAEDVNELRLIGSLIQKRVGDLTSKLIQDKDKTSNFDLMSDDEFNEYLDNKYKKNDSLSWLNTNFLTKEEQVRFNKLIENSLKTYSEKIKKEKLNRPCNCIKLGKLDNSCTHILDNLKYKK